MARAKLTLAGVSAYLQQRAPTSRVHYIRRMTMDRIYRRVVKAAHAAKLPGIAQSMWYGTPSLAVKGKSFMRVKDAGTFVFRCALEGKEVLMEAVPKIYFETDHYKGWPAVLVRASAVPDAELAQRVARAWRRLAPKKLLNEVERATQKSAPLAKKKSSAKRR